MSPCSWSAPDGHGMESCGEQGEVEAAVGLGTEGKLKSGVSTGWVTWGAGPPEGVEACSVANRSTGCVATGRLQPAVSIEISKVSRIFLFRFMFGLDGFQVTLFAGQDFCAET